MENALTMGSLYLSAFVAIGVRMPPHPNPYVAGRAAVANFLSGLSECVEAREAPVVRST